jgi:uncharacterized membrane protein YtjA (UPF0391 family)
MWRIISDRIGGMVFLSVSVTSYYSPQKNRPMLRWTLIFLVIALIAGAFGFFGIAAGAAEIAKILFFIFIVLFLLSLIGRGRWWGRSDLP